MADPKEERTWAMFCHLSALTGFVGVPFGSILGPVIIMLIKREELPSLDAHGKEAINFQLAMLIYFIIAGILVLLVIGVFLLIALMIVNIVCVILASIKANEGGFYRYPMSIQFIK